MKKLIIATSIICTLSLTTAFAAAEDVNQRVQELKTEFNLNDRQTHRIQRIMGGKMTEEQRAERRAKHMERRMARMQEKLGLSDDQVAKIKSIRENQQSTMKTTRESFRSQIAALLTPEQKTKFAQMQEKRQNRMGRHGRHHGGKGGHGHRAHRGGHCQKGSK